MRFDTNNTTKRNGKTIVGTVTEGPNGETAYRYENVIHSVNFEITGGATVDRAKALAMFTSIDGLNDLVSPKLLVRGTISDMKLQQIVWLCEAKGMSFAWELDRRYGF